MKLDNIDIIPTWESVDWASSVFPKLVRKPTKCNAKEPEHLFAYPEKGYSFTWGKSGWFEKHDWLQGAVAYYEREVGGIYKLIKIKG